MKKYRFKVSLLVEAEAYTPADAFDAVQETFSIGEEYGLVITDCEYEELNPTE